MNQRWITLKSEANGRDWFAKSQAIDEALPSFGLQLEQEKIYLIYREDSCLVARPVFGPKRNPPAPFGLLDIENLKVLRSIETKSWDDFQDIAKNAMIVQLSRSDYSILEVGY